MRKQRGIGQRLLYDAFADCRNCFGHCTNAPVIFYREKKRPQERAVHAIAESQLFRAHPSVECGAKFRREFNIRPQERMPCF